MFSDSTRVQHRRLILAHIELKTTGILRASFAFPFLSPCCLCLTWKRFLHWMHAIIHPEFIRKLVSVHGLRILWHLFQLSSSIIINPSCEGKKSLNRMYYLYKLAYLWIYLQTLDKVTNVTCLQHFQCFIQ